ncbi:MAG: hypothetical protein ACFWUC_12685 [Oscillospiraceae bacterium]|jgi:hypothetical protein
MESRNKNIEKDMTEIASKMEMIQKKMEWEKICRIEEKLDTILKKLGDE